MITFANELSRKILSQEHFWEDFTFITSLVLADDVDSIAEEATPLPQRDALTRLTTSASFLAQSDLEEHRSLAQDIVVYLILGARDPVIQDAACNILSLLGNQPGAFFLRGKAELRHADWKSYLQTNLLRNANEVIIGDKKISLTDYQMQLWSLLGKGRSVAVSAPTSAGKTFLILEYILRMTKSSKSSYTVIIVPTRALLTEIHTKITEHKEFDAETTRASTIPTLDSEDRKKQIFILTQERLQILLSIAQFEFSYVVVDEAQAISEGTRGIILHDCLDRISSISPNARYFFLTPGASELQRFEQIVQSENLKVKETSFGPVVQNRIVVQTFQADPKRLSLQLMNNGRRIDLRTIQGQRGFTQPATVAAAVALELGQEGASLVYAPGPAAAEETASQMATLLPDEDSPALKDLAKFVAEHIHPKYSLVSTVKKGVGFHYGKMPALLRLALEDAFSNGHLKYLVCTTTLFQGVNLPAKSVFIATSRRGRTAQLDAAALWNFIGRAGRLGKEALGNVYLINYDNWEEKPLDKRKRFEISPSFKSVVTSDYGRVVKYLDDPDGFDSTEMTPELEAAAGLLVSKSASNTAKEFLNRSMGGSINDDQRQELISKSDKLLHSIDIPIEVISTNWTVSPVGQKRLRKRFLEKIRAGDVESLIPIHPQEGAAYNRYIAVFSRLNREINGKSSSAKFNNKLTYQALAWMRGNPLPAIIKKEVDWAASQKSSSKPNTAIRNALAFIEDELRFRYVQLGRCYVDLLRHALLEEGLDKEAATVYDFPLALELGVSSTAGQVFIELGLSRITASVLEDSIPDSDPTVKKARDWIMKIDRSSSKFSSVIWNELIKKGLREEAI